MPAAPPRVPAEIVTLAFQEAEECASAEEVPVGAVVCRPESTGHWIVLGRGRNRIVSSRDPTAHAELSAIREACRRERSERLPGAVLVSTLEPCVMCTGAILLARLEAVYYCARTESGVGLEDVLVCPSTRWKGLNHTVRAEALVEHADRSARLLRDFFAARRAASQHLDGNNS